MLMFRLIGALGTLAALGVSFGAFDAHASVVEAIGLEDLVTDADEVGVAEVLSKESLWKGSIIVTRYRVRMDQPLKGQCGAGDEVVVEVPGGAVGEVGLRVEGAPTLQIGKRALIFARSDAGGVLRSVGMAQGVLHIRTEGGQAFVYPDRRGLVTVHRDAAGLSKAAPSMLTKRQKLGEAIEQVQALVRKTGTK